MLVALIAVFLLTFFGPFDTFASIPMMRRLLFWVGLIVGCGIFFHVIVMYAIHNPYLSKFSRFQRMLIGSSVAAFPGLAVFLAVSYLLRDQVYPIENFPFLWLTVFVIGTLISAANFLPPFANLQFERDSRRNIKPEDIPLLARIPKTLGSHLISVSIQDHYLEIVTNQGAELIHMSFSNAMEELETYPGIQIHRSHWIAEEALVGLQKKGRTTFAVTSDGRELPVSLPFREKAEAILQKND